MSPPSTFLTTSFITSSLNKERSRAEIAQGRGHVSEQSFWNMLKAVTNYKRTKFDFCSKHAKLWASQRHVLDRTLTFFKMELHLCTGMQQLCVSRSHSSEVMERYQSTECHVRPRIFWAFCQMNNSRYNIYFWQPLGLLFDKDSNSKEARKFLW